MPFTATLQLTRGGARVPLTALPAGGQGLRLVHRVDVFRPRDFTPRGHEITRECLPVQANDEPAPPPAFCSDLSLNADGGLINADDLRPATSPDGGAPTGDGSVDGGAPADDEPPVLTLLVQRGAVLEVTNGSQPRVPEISDDDPSTPLTAKVTFTADDRYWAKYWAKCRGCLGLVWIEAQLDGKSWCPTPTRGSADEPSDVSLTLDFDEPPAAGPAPGASGPDAVPCGDRSWFQAIYRDNGDDVRKEAVIPFRP